MLDITYDKLYTLTINSEYQTLSQDVIKEVGQLVVAYYASHNIGKPFPIYSFLTDIDWKWMASRGTLPKRIKKWYYDQFTVALDETVLTGIGNYVRKEIAKNQTYYLDFTKKFDWQAGDYGDHGSCFFSDRSYIKLAMQEDPRIIAMRFFTKEGIPPIFKGVKSYLAKKNPVHYDEDNIYHGQSRAWIARDVFSFKNKDIQKDFEAFIIFNGYGHTTKNAASIFSHFSGLDLKNIQLSNEGKAVQGLYFNEGGFLAAPKEVLDSVESYDFGLLAKSITAELNDELGIRRKGRTKGFDKVARAIQDEGQSFGRIRWTSSKVTGLQVKAGERLDSGVYDPNTQQRHLLKEAGLTDASMKEQHDYFDGRVKEFAFTETMKAYKDFEIKRKKDDAKQADTTLKCGTGRDDSARDTLRVAQRLRRQMMEIAGIPLDAEPHPFEEQVEAVFNYQYLMER